MEVFSQEWFEMRDLRARLFADAVWIPLRISEEINFNNGAKEFLGAGAVAFSLEKREIGENVDWHSIGLLHEARPYAYTEGDYKTAETYQENDHQDAGINLVFVHQIGNGHPSTWLVNQDLILALKLLQEGDVWVCPDEGYTPVLRQRRNKDGRIIAIEIRSEFLRDYLCARSLDLRISYYRQRLHRVDDASHISWPKDGISESKPHDRFSAAVREVDADGGPFGGGVALFHVWRTDIDIDADVPVFGPENGTNTASSSRSFNRAGQKFYCIEGELWREEWIERSQRSERVRGDDSPETIFYVTDASGQRQSHKELNSEDIGRYLWFDPKVFLTISKQRGSGHTWYTQYTGEIWLLPDWRTHFGINRLGFINIYAYDIAKLPIWQQRIWAAHNVSPDGAVCAELLSSQMKAQPADTAPAEGLLPEVLDALDKECIKWLGEPLFNQHNEVSIIFAQVHRFRALEAKGLLALAKDIARLTADRIRLEALNKIVSPTKGEKWGTLKTLESALASICSDEISREIVGPLVGIYKLRLADAHLPSSSISEAYILARVNEHASSLEQGQQIIESAVKSLIKVYDVIKEHNNKA